MPPHPPQPQHRNSVDFAGLFRCRSATHPPQHPQRPAIRNTEPGAGVAAGVKGGISDCGPTAPMRGFSAHRRRGSLVLQKEDCPRPGGKPGGVPTLFSITAVPVGTSRRPGKAAGAVALYQVVGRALAAVETAGEKAVLVFVSIGAGVPLHSSANGPILVHVQAAMGRGGRGKKIRQ